MSGKKKAEKIKEEHEFKLEIKSTIDESYLQAARLYDANPCKKENVKRAFDLFKKSAKSGNKKAQYWVAYLIDNHILNKTATLPSLQMNMAEAKAQYVQYLTLSASGDDGYPVAQFTLADYFLTQYRMDEAGPKQLSEAEKAVYKKGAYQYFLEASRRLPEAKYKLGLCHFSGIGVKEDPESGFKIFSQLESTLEPKYDPLLNAIRFQLARCFRTGFGVRKNTQEAKRYLKLCSERHKNSDAKLELAELYLESGSIDEIRAGLSILELHAAKGNVEAMKSVYHFFLHLSRREDYCREVSPYLPLDFCREKTFFYLFELSKYCPKEAGEKAAVNLAKSYIYGVGTKKDPEKAYATLEAASKKGNVYAMVFFGKVLFR